MNDNQIVEQLDNVFEQLVANNLLSKTDARLLIEVTARVRAKLAKKDRYAALEALAK